MENIDPLAAYRLGLAILLIILIGIVVDIILVSSFWEKRPWLLRRKRAPVTWQTRDMAWLCAGLFVIYLFANTISYLLGKLITGSDIFWPRVIAMAGNTAVYILGCGFIIYYLKTNCHNGLFSLGLRWRSWWSGACRSALAYLGFIPFLFLLSYIGFLLCSSLGIDPEPHQLIALLKQEQPWWYAGYLLVIAVFIAPVFEEILFRGVFYQWLKKKWGLPGAVVLSSGFFSLLHFNAVQFLPVMGLGMLLCFIFEYTGSLLPAIMIHILNNGVFLGLFLLLKSYYI